MLCFSPDFFSGVEKDACKLTLINSIVFLLGRCSMFFCLMGNERELKFVLATRGREESEKLWKQV
jgi:hypothetical protein